MTARVPETALASETSAKLERLLARLRGFDRCLVALSGGVDSAVVAKAAVLALGQRAWAVTGTSASLAEGELQQATELARLIGIRHQVITTDEFANPRYVENSPQRCYHCKTELYTQLAALTGSEPGVVIVNGANADDRGDYRPGMAAAAENRVESPLLECGLTKAEVRSLAAYWQLPVWEKPATPCLSSRVAYGEAVTPARLAMIDQAERYLRAQGLGELRVRYHAGDLARIEVPASQIQRLATPPLAEQLVSELRRLGFQYVTLDLQGFRSGSLNRVLPVESLRMLG